MGRRRLSEKVVEEALEQTFGNVAAAARVLGVTGSAVRHYVKTRPKIKERIEEQREAILDFCETGLLKAAMAGEPWAIKFGLTKLAGARERGYGSGRQVEIAGGVRVEVADTEESDDVADALEGGVRAISRVAAYLESIGAGRPTDTGEPLRLDDRGDGAPGE